MRKRGVNFGLIFLSANALITANLCAEVSFTFTRVADTNDGYMSFGPMPVRDNFWTTFSATLPNGDEVVVVKSTASAKTFVVAPAGSGFELDPRIDAQNGIAYWVRRSPSAHQIQRSNGTSSLFTLVDTTTSGFSEIIGPPVQFFGDDEVTFAAELDSGGSGVFRRTFNGGIITIIDSSGSFASFGPSVRPAHYPAVGALFSGELDAGGKAVATATSVGALLIVADTDGRIADFVGELDIKDGIVAYIANLDDGGHAVYADSDPIIDSSGPFESFEAACYRQNWFLHLAFLATTDEGGRGLFYYNHLAKHLYPIIQVGDALDGSIVTDLASSSDRDSLGTVFRATLADGRSGIYLADFVCGQGQCFGDFVGCIGSNSVDVDELIQVIQAWGRCPSDPHACPADLSPEGGDGVVNVDDLLELIAHWGPCPE